MDDHTNGAALSMQWLFGADDVAKAIWGSSMGKARLAKRLVDEMPAHRVYVEPFAGSGAVLLAKPPSDVEVVNDLDPEIAAAFRFVKGMTPAQLEQLRHKKWVGDAELFKRLVDMDPPKDPVERFYRFVYLTRFGFNSLRRGTLSDARVGKHAGVIKKLERFAPRFKKVVVRCKDYEAIFNEFDGRDDVFFFLDPPYAGYNAGDLSGSDHDGWDEERFVDAVAKLRGRCLITYGIRGNGRELFEKAGLVVRRWKHLTGVGLGPDNGGSVQRMTLIVTNYDPGKVKTYQVGRVAKTVWGSPAGKKRLAERLVAMLPGHTTYTEPFVGSGAVLFEKEPVRTEAVNDADAEIAHAFRTLKRLTAGEMNRLRRMKWTADFDTFKRLLASHPKDPIERLHRFLYTSHFSYGRLRDSYNHQADGTTATTIERIEKFAPRLRKVRVFCGDYAAVVKRFDGPNAVHFLDPPYAGYDVAIGEGKFDEDAFFDLLCRLKGRFLLTYGIRGRLPKLLRDDGRFEIKQIRPPRYIRGMTGVSQLATLTTLIVTNYKPVEKAEDEIRKDGWELTEVAKAQAFGTFGGSHHYAKRLLPLLPEHKVYVEPFAGAAALLHVKEPSAKEVIADIDDDTVFMHRFIKAMTPEIAEELRRRFEWKVSRASFDRAREMQPKDEQERFYKLVFVRTHARDCRPDGTHPALHHIGSRTDPMKYVRSGERLRDVTILKRDYRKTIHEFDGRDTFFFLDPPYPDEWFDKDAAVDFEEFVQTAKGIEGKFIAVINDTPANAAGFRSLGHVFRMKVHEASGLGGAKTASRLFVANFQVRKSESVTPLNL